MPAKLERCVRSVRRQGKSESSAYAICTKATSGRDAMFQGKRVTLRQPRYIQKGEPGYGRKKFVVYVRANNGTIRRVVFGDPNMKIKKSNPERRKNFRKRHNCENPGPPTKPRYWSCKKW